MPPWTFQLKVYSGRLGHSSTILTSSIWGYLFFTSYCPHCKLRPRCGLRHKVGKEQMEMRLCRTVVHVLAAYFLVGFYISLQQCLSYNHRMVWVLLQFGFSLFYWVFSCPFIGLSLRVRIVKEQKRPKDLTLWFSSKKIILFALW